MTAKDFEGVERGIHAALATLQDYMNRPTTPGVLVTHGVPPHQRLVDRALAYLDAITPYNHPARDTLLVLTDVVRRWHTHGRPGPGRDRTETDVLLAALLDIYERTVPEVYTLTRIQDVDDWLPAEDRKEDLSVRLLASNGAIGLFGGWSNKPPRAGHAAATLVFYKEGLPVAQVAVNQLVELASVAEAVKVANYPPQPDDRCAHVEPGAEAGCDHEPGYVVMIGGTIYLVCQDHLAVTLGSQGGYVIAMAPF